jgi:hypothetical protein
MKFLLTTTAVIEAVAGLALLAFPSATAQVLLGAPLDQSAAAILIRVGGAAVVGLAIVCWLARGGAYGQNTRGLMVAILFYNFAVVGVLAFANIVDGLHGTLLWPAVAFHVVMNSWCIMIWLSIIKPTLTNHGVGASDYQRVEPAPICFASSKTGETAPLAHEQ